MDNAGHTMMALDAADETSDDALMALFANGDPQAAAILAYRHTPRILALSVRLLGDQSEADDVAQDAMMRLWKIAPDWRQGEAKVSTWLYRVAHNLCVDRLRKRRGTQLDVIPEPEDDRPPIEAVMIEADRAEALHKALADLPDRQREAIVLRHLQELSNPEIAEVLDISVEAVESLLARGKRALAGILKGQQNMIGSD